MTTPALSQLRTRAGAAAVSVDMHELAHGTHPLALMRNGQMEARNILLRAAADAKEALRAAENEARGGADGAHN